MARWRLTLDENMNHGPSAISFPERAVALPLPLVDRLERLTP
jgi:hypothetical protein